MLAETEFAERWKNEADEYVHEMRRISLPVIAFGVGFVIAGVLCAVQGYPLALLHLLAISTFFFAFVAMACQRIHNVRRGCVDHRVTGRFEKSTAYRFDLITQIAMLAAVAIGVLPILRPPSFRVPPHIIVVSWCLVAFVCFCLVNALVRQALWENHAYILLGHECLEVLNPAGVHVEIPRERLTSVAFSTQYNGHVTLAVDRNCCSISGERLPILGIVGQSRVYRDGQVHISVVYFGDNVPAMRLRLSDYLISAGAVRRDTT